MKKYFFFLIIFSAVSLYSQESRSSTNFQPPAGNHPEFNRHYFQLDPIQSFSEELTHPNGTKLPDDVMRGHMLVHSRLGGQLVVAKKLTINGKNYYFAITVDGNKLTGEAAKVAYEEYHPRAGRR